MATAPNKPTPRFRDLIQKPESEVEAIPIHPVGHFRGIMHKTEFGEFDGKDGKVDTVEFYFESREPLGDVNPDEWESYRENAAAKRSTRLRTRIFVERENLRRFYDFLIKKFGCTSGQTGEQMLEQVQGAECIYEVKHGTSKDGNPFADINRVLNYGEDGPSAE